MADPTPDDVRAALAVLAAAEAAREAAANAEAEQVVPSESPVDVEPLDAGFVIPVEPAYDPYESRSPKQTATGHENPGPPFRVYE